MRKLTKLIVALTATMGLIIGSAGQASATEVGVVIFTGKANVNPGLWAPLFGPGQPGAGWNFASGTANPPLNALPGCVAASVSIKKAFPVSAGACTINANGVLGPDPNAPNLPPPLPGPGAYCGSTSAPPVGTGTVTQGAQVYNLSQVGWSISAAGLLVVQGTVTKTTGTNPPGPFVALVAAIPDITKAPLGSVPCLTVAANSFFIAGVAAYVI